jgi:glycosyltransferase involved in cell wall biosynthesis
MGDLFIYNRLSKSADADTEKCIIITEFFPPNNCAASNRVFSWVKNLYQYGYYPVIFCRNDLNNEVYYFEKTALYEVHYIKCKDPFFQRKRLSAKNALVRKFFGLLHYVFVNSIKYNGIKCMKKFLDHFILENNIKKIVVTAPSYALFGLGNILCKQHQIKWIADYRDDWSTSEIFSSKFFELVGKIDRIKEKKYLSNCTFFTSVSNYYLEKIANLINKKGFLIENGFNEMEAQIFENCKTDQFIILYPGSLYFTQRLDYIGAALNLLPKEILQKLTIVFLGTEIDAIKLPKICVPFLNKNLLFIKRTSRSEVSSFYKKADAFLLIAHTDKNNRVLKGIPSSKLYEYISLRKKVLVCPSDHDVIEEKLKESEQGIFCNTPKEMAEAINNLFQIKCLKGYIPVVKISNEILYKNTREFQTSKLAQVLDSL